MASINPDVVALEATDSALRREFTGPIKKRSCTDIPCCIVFIIFVLGFFTLTLWSFAYGDYRRVLFPTNSRGQVCGRDVPGRPYLVFFDLVVCLNTVITNIAFGCPTPQVCVKSCPTYYWSWQTENQKDSREKMLCLDGKDGNDPRFANQSVAELVQNRKCAPYLLESKAIFGRCLPSQLTALLANKDILDSQGKAVSLKDADDKAVTGRQVIAGRSVAMYLTDVFENIVADLLATWHVILVAMVVSLLLSLVWVFLLRCFASWIVWITLLLFVLLFSVATGLCFYRWNVLSKSNEVVLVGYTISYYLHSANTWLAFGIISLILLVIMLLVLIFLRKRILIAIAILKEVSKAIASMTSVLFWPAIPMLLELMVIAQVAFIAISLRSIVDPVGNQDPIIPGTREEQGKVDIRNMFQLIPCDPLANSTAGKACRFLYYGNRRYTVFLQLYNLFMLYWLLNFVNSWAEMTLAGSFAELYYSRDRASVSTCSVLRSFGRSIFYHMGSLAFGSFLIALLQWLRSLLEYVDAKIKKYNNGFTRCLFKCCCCFLWCLEKFLRILNRNAFIMIAIYGQSFCSGARSAFHLLSRNIIRLVVVDKVTDFVLFIGKLVVVGTTAGLTYLYLDGVLFANIQFEELDNLHYVFVPLLIIILGSYLIVSSFSRVYGMGVDTIFLCFLDDLERNNGSPERPYFMSKDLMKILGKENHPVKEKKDKKATTD